MSEPEHPAVSLEIAEILRALAAPFPPDKIKWRPGAVSGARCRALPYVDARQVMKRLNQVVGADNWQTEFVPIGEGALICRLSLRIGGEWITKSDVGGRSKQADASDSIKAAASGAFKRAAVSWGIGYHLYSIPAQWVDYDPKTKQIKGKPQVPTTTKRAAREAPKERAPAPVRDAGSAPLEDARTLLARLRKKDENLFAQGMLPSRGYLLTEVSRHGQIEVPGLPADIERWPMPEGVAIATRAVRAVEPFARAAVLQRMMARLKVKWSEVVEAAGLAEGAEIDRLAVADWHKAREALRTGIEEQEQRKTAKAG